MIDSNTASSHQRRAFILEDNAASRESVARFLAGLNGVTYLASAASDENGGDFSTIAFGGAEPQLSALRDAVASAIALAPSPVAPPAGPCVVAILSNFSTPALRSAVAALDGGPACFPELEPLATYCAALPPPHGELGCA